MDRTDERGTSERAVEALLARSASWRALPPDERQAIARDTVTVADALIEEQRAVAGDASEVALPGFVAGLVRGVFQAVVDASIDQMKAYGELVASIAGSVADFAAEHVDGSDQRASLARRRDRQQLLATMVLMGINRIVVTDGRIAARAADDDD